MDLLLKKKHRVSFFMFPAKYENVNLKANKHDDA